VQQCDAAGAVRVVLDRGNLGVEVVLVALEVDDAVLLLVATTLVTRGDAAVGVATTLGVLLGEQRLLRRRLRDFGEVGHRLEAAAGARWFAFADSHVRPLSASI
jgi:hypothetical protein